MLIVTKRRPNEFLRMHGKYQAGRYRIRKSKGSNGVSKDTHIT